MIQSGFLIGGLNAQRIRKGRIKFGIEIQGTVEEAVSLNKKNDNSLWQDYIEKDMNNSRITFKLMERHGEPHVGYTEIACHLVFDLNMYMTRKAQCMAGGSYCGHTNTYDLLECCVL